MEKILHEDSSIKPSKPLIIAFSFEVIAIFDLGNVLKGWFLFVESFQRCGKISKGQLEAHLNLEAAGGGDFAWVQFDLKHSTRFEITLHLHLPQTVTSQTLSASIAFKSCLLLPLLLVHASQLKQRDLDRNCKEFLRLQKMFNFIAGLMTIP
ncbi:hypothetical protein T4A_8612 [Trichinella pseudospiralis]|uniref:Uncharacterized protein n=1 Tax=Trichinella pseudospiralis TaxID=6337 RepID=A0A0V1E7Q3_TRIPS|nr:hypothetical protein T4A_8612 [Trichinella pseudospiralis]